jgi:hypothetical protein
MTTPKRPTRTARETWEALEKQSREDEIDRFLALTPAQVDARLRAAGQDPAAVRAEGEALAKQLRADRERLAWQAKAASGLAREQARVEARSGKYADFSRVELLAHIAVARKNPRLAQPVAVMFRNRKPEEASEAELRDLLEEIEALADRSE